MCKSPKRKTNTCQYNVTTLTLELIFACESVQPESVTWAGGAALSVCVDRIEAGDLRTGGLATLDVAHLSQGKADMSRHSVPAYTSNNAFKNMCHSMQDILQSHKLSLVQG